jgi:Fe-Mn family superoxide dismutase
MTRREVLAAAAASYALASGAGGGAVAKGAEPIELSPLPYDLADLEPHVSHDTLRFHYGKHHAAYVANTNRLIQGTDLADLPLHQIVQRTAANPDQIGLFRNAAQAWNHEFYWQSMTPRKGVSPSIALRDALDDHFGGYQAFIRQFSKAATTKFASGWVWLVADHGVLRIETTDDAETPITAKKTPLLTLDVWEHAYYLDYQNRRADYVAAVVENLLNWEFAEKNLARA